MSLTSLESDISVEQQTKISIYSALSYQKCMNHSTEWERNNEPYYKTIACMKPVVDRSRKTTIIEAYEKLKDKITDSLEEVILKKLQNLCILPIGHSGKCSHDVHSGLFNHNTLKCKLDWIYTTPGDDDYIYKNRASRLFPIVVDDIQEKAWRNKNVKQKCAIPLREKSTPLMMASAYIDYLVLILSIKGISAHINTNYIHYESIMNIVKTHKVNLSEFYKNINLSVFDADGFTICPIIKRTIQVNDIINNNISDRNSIQLGHIIPRSETEFTIRGKNIVLMTRDGNRLVGDYRLDDSEWLTLLKNVVLAHSPV
jgi:hypothetical protein